MDYTNTYDSHLAYPTSGSAADPAVAAIVAIVFVVMILFFLIAYVFTAFLLGRIFKKAGVPQWPAWVPIYSTWKMLEIGDQPGFWAILTLVPFVNIIAGIFLYISMFHIGKKLGKEDWFVLVAIFLPIVWLIWLAFDDSKWPVEKKFSAKPVTAKTPAKTTTKPKKASKL